MAETNVPKKSPKSTHICKKTSVLKKQEAIITRHEELLDRIGPVILGNGHKEDGLLYLFREHVKGHDTIVSDIKDIKLKLSLVTEVNNELEIQRRVSIEVNKVKENIKTETENAANSNLKKRGISLQTVSTIVSIITITVILVFSLLNYNLGKQNKQVNIENSK